jgi:hypothetical protein
MGKGQFMDVPSVSFIGGSHLSALLYMSERVKFSSSKEENDAFLL